MGTISIGRGTRVNQRTMARDPSIGVVARRLRRLCPLVLLLAFACSSGPPVGPREGHRAPAFSLTTLEGTPIEVPAASPSLVVFWASWCGPCRREAKEIAGIVESYGSRVSVVSVNSGEDPTKARLAAEQWGMSWPVALDPRGQVSAAYELTAVPLVLVIDAQGVVRYRGNALPSDPHRLLDGLSG